MKRILLALSLLLFATTLLAQAPVAAAPAAPTSAAATPEEIHQVLVDRIDLYKKSVGIVVGTIGPQGQKIYSYGKLAAGGATPDGDTVYEIGSNTKVFTSLLLADMVRRGEVKLDDPVSKYLPDAVKMPERNGRKITLVDLATHTSGLPRLPNNLHPKDPLNPYADYTVEQMYEFLSGYTLTRDIGEKYEYSNLGVGLLGHVLARRTGMSYEQLVTTRILKPLGMASSGITLTADLRARLARGHNDALYPVANWDIPTFAGAGALRSTANDLLKFLAANLGLAPSPLAEAMKAQLAVRKPTGTPNLEIALGWHILTRNDNEIVWHNGGTGGYHTFMAFSPKTRTGVVVLSNSSNSIDDVGRHVIDGRFPLDQLTPAKTHQEAAIDPRIFDGYVGRYEIAPGVVVEVTRKGDALFAQVTGQSQFQIFPESETDFFFKVVDAQITFVKQEGKVAGLVIHQGGQDVPAKRRE